MDRQNSEASTEGVLSSPRRSASVSDEVDNLEMKDQLGEADKQILEWAGKLEIESIDLREKSNALSSVFTKTSEMLGKQIAVLSRNLAEKNAKTNTIGDSEKSNLTAIMTKMEGKIETQYQKINAQLDNLTQTAKSANKSLSTGSLEKTIKNYWETCNDSIKADITSIQTRMEVAFEINQNYLLSIAKQMEGFHEVLASISLEIKQLSDRGTALENKILENKTFIASDNDESLTLFGTTLENDSQDKIVEKVTSVKRQLRKRKVGKKPVSKAATKDTKIKETQPKRTRDTSRTIIPWAEIGTYYSSEL